MSVLQRPIGYRAAALMPIAVLLLSAGVQAQNFVYNVSELVAGVEPAGVIFEDFNRDSRIDVAVANYGDNTVSIFMGASGAKFAAKVNYSTGAEPTGLVAADLRGTGKLDIVTVNIGSGGVDAPGSVSVLLGNGSGTFQKHVDYPVGNYPTGVVAGDFNGDGKLDLAVSNAYSNTVSILFGNGDGTFQSQLAITVGNQPMSIAIGDFNGDGKLDLVTSCVESGVLSMLLSKGDGGFTRLDSSYGIPGPGDVVIAVGDFNRDGKLDVAVSEPLSLLLGNGDGTFQNPVAVPTSGVNRVTTLVAGDFNHDGKVDLAAYSLSGLTVLLGKGDGTFRPTILSPSVPPNTTPPGSIAFADINGDGRLDVAASNGVSVSLLLGKGDGSFAVPKNVDFVKSTYGPDASVVADFNGDGKLDIAVAEVGFPHGQVSVLLGTGAAKFGTPLKSPLASQAINNNDEMLVGDFNGDGRLDLIVMDDYAKGFQVLLGNGDGTFKAPVDTNLGTPLTLAVGDFDGDGETDVVVTTTTVNAQVLISIYLSNGNGTFRLGQQYTQVYGGVNVADVNKDGKEDLVIISFAHPLLVMLGNGNGTFQKAISGPTASYIGEAVIRDFNGDGKPDIVAVTYNGIAFLRGNSDGTFVAPVYSNSTLQFCCQVSAGDFNGDGKLDVVSNLYNAVRVIPGKGDGTFQSPTAYSQNGQLSTGNIVVGDFNDDGVSDVGLVINDQTTGATEASLYLSEPTVHLFPKSVNFGSETVGNTTLPSTIYLRNVGNAKLSIFAITVSGTSFLEKTTCGKPLAIGGLCTVQVSFKPIAKGIQRGTVTISGSATPNPQTILLQGTGQ
jgi:hypothetical protein